MYSHLLEEMGVALLRFQATIFPSSLKTQWIFSVSFSDLLENLKHENGVFCPYSKTNWLFSFTLASTKNQILTKMFFISIRGVVIALVIEC